MKKEIKKDWLCFKFFADTRGGCVIDWKNMEQELIIFCSIHVNFLCTKDLHRYGTDIVMVCILNLTYFFISGKRNGIHDIQIYSF